MPFLRDAQPSESRKEYTHAAETQVALLELLDEKNLVWLVEVPLPRPDLIGDAEYECLELPASSLVFDKDLADEMPAPEIRDSSRCRQVAGR